MKKTLIIALALVMTLSLLSVSAFAKGETNYVTGSTVEGPAYKDVYNGNLADGQVGTTAYDNLWAGFYNNADNADNNYDGTTGVITVN
ncbi:MAG: hypothetical protein II377_03770, partial [Clostridia bacterium]|nr:hypothetical protein [Clostridia bacterium]